VGLVSRRVVLEMREKIQQASAPGRGPIGALAAESTVHHKPSSGRRVLYYKKSFMSMPSRRAAHLVGYVTSNSCGVERFVAD